MRMDSFSTLIRTASHQQHVEAETSTFMSDLLGGGLGDRRTVEL